jgi:hypothetical protein
VVERIPAAVRQLLHCGAVIPAHPLALDAQRRLDERRQRALSRYYLDAGAGGLAVGVHTTQFAIREHGLYAPVLKLAMDTAQTWEPLGGRRPLVMIAGLSGGTEQARREASTARELGYHAGLLSLAAMRGRGVDEILAHCEAVAQEIALVGFYLPPSGRPSPACPRWWPSRSPPSTATAPWTCCAAWWRRGRRSASRCTPATTTTSCWTC